MELFCKIFWQLPDMKMSCTQQIVLRITDTQDLNVMRNVAIVIQKFAYYTALPYLAAKHLSSFYFDMTVCFD